MRGLGSSIVSRTRVYRCIVKMPPGAKDVQDHPQLLERIGIITVQMPPGAKDDRDPNNNDFTIHDLRLHDPRPQKEET